MDAWGYLALGLELWTAVGLLGLAVSLTRRERRKAVQGVASLLGVWAIYLAVLLAVSARQPERRVELGKPECFGSMCFTVERVDEVPAFSASNQVREIEQRLLRVTVRVENRGKAAAREEVGAYLRDSYGRVWLESAAVSGNPLDGPVAAGGVVISEPIFRLAPDASGMDMVLAHGRYSRHRLIVGDAESFGHRPTVMALSR